MTTGKIQVVIMAEWKKNYQNLPLVNSYHFLLLFMQKLTQKVAVLDSGFSSSSNTSVKCFHSLYYHSQYFHSIRHTIKSGVRGIGCWMSKTIRWRVHNNPFWVTLCFKVFYAPVPARWHEHRKSFLISTLFGAICKTSVLNPLKPLIMSQSIKTWLV